MYISSRINRLIILSSVALCMAGLSAAELSRPDASGFAKDIIKQDAYRLCTEIKKAAKLRQGPDIVIRDLTYQGAPTQMQAAFRHTCLRTMASQTFRHFYKRGVFKGHLLFDGRLVSNKEVRNGQHKNMTQSPWKDLATSEIVRAYYHVMHAKIHDKKNYPFFFIASQAPARPQPQPIPFILP